MKGHGWYYVIYMLFKTIFGFEAVYWFWGIVLGILALYGIVKLIMFIIGSRETSKYPSYNTYSGNTYENTYENTYRETSYDENTYKKIPNGDNDRIRLAVIEKEHDCIDMRAKLEGIAYDCKIEVEVIADNANDFFAKYWYNPSKVDALIVDIDEPSIYAEINNVESIRKPTLYICERNVDYLKNIEGVREKIGVAMHITKPFNDEQFKNKVLDFCREIKLHQFCSKMLVFNQDGERVEIIAKEIVLIEPYTQTIYFKTDKPLKLNDIALSKIIALGMETDEMIQVDLEHYVNKGHIESKNDKEITVSYMDDLGSMTKKTLECL